MRCFGRYLNCTSGLRPRRWRQTGVPKVHQSSGGDCRGLLFGPVVHPMLPDFLEHQERPHAPRCGGEHLRSDWSSTADVLVSGLLEFGKCILVGEQAHMADMWHVGGLKQVELRLHMRASGNGTPRSIRTTFVNKHDPTFNVLTPTATYLCPLFFSQLPIDRDDQDHTCRELCRGRKDQSSKISKMVFG